MNSTSLEGNNFNARLVIGPIQVCGLLTAALFGCLACQSYLYFARFTSDHLALKATVSAVFLIQLGHFICVISTLWTMTVSTYGDPSQLIKLPLAIDLAIPLTGLTVFVAQSFYAFRLWKLTRNIFLPILCEMISVVAQTATFIITAGAISMRNLESFGEGQTRMIELSFIARAACDLITTASIAWFLAKKRNSDIKAYDYPSSPHTIPYIRHRTMTMVDRLIYWTIETALLTSSMAVTLATWFLVQKQQNFLWIGAWFLWPNVVGNSFLASLNRRLLLRDGGARGGQSHGMTTIMFNAAATQSHADPLEPSVARSEMLDQSGPETDLKVWSGSYASRLTDEETRC
ncbi:uncharacterized protein EDB91DRAFT_1298172 [Suillus paluster]|uniref:uncharacterized protein n=1 Tax=Suillus paluster TaxID=48578 RepID=UPI001B884DDB|nr:uncharacterized protein EDB91DRAFT_1298172 [Suillus paluster]KAG1751392.1 hypothetical protein EDB91DRAFT_1298172 [Suillus paluster]